MNLVNDQISRQKLQIIAFKILIATIALLAIIFLIRDEGFLFGIH